MTQKIIELKQAPVVLLELPENSNNHRIEGLIGLYRMDYLVYDTPHENNVSFRLPVGVKYNVVGILSDLTEEQFAEWVKSEDFKHYSGKYLHLFVDYLNCENAFESSSDSFYSLLESENVYTENPHDYMLQSTEENFDNCKCDKTELQIVREKWGQAQQRTIDPKRTVVLLRKGETK